MGAHEQAPDPRRRAFFTHPFQAIKQALGPIADEQFFEQTPSDESRMGRRDLFKHTASTTGEKSLGFIEGYLNFIQNMAIGVGETLLQRRKLLIAGGGLLAIGLALSEVFKNDPHFIANTLKKLQDDGGDLKIRADLNDVWEEVLELQNPPSHKDLLEQVHNAFKPIQLTEDELDTAIIVDDEDSEGVVDGIRKNSDGPEQPGSWSLVAAQKLTAGLRVLGRKGTVKAYNFSQPGASSTGLVGLEQPEGNVQLGAQTAVDMTADHAGEPTPTEIMTNHEGFLFASIGLHGDDMRDTADMLLKYLDPESKDYSAIFVDFLQRATKTNKTAEEMKAVKEMLYDDKLRGILKEILTSYKNDKTRIKTNFKKALNDYEVIYNKRQGEGKGRMVLLVSQPPALDEYDTIPYVKLGSKRGQTGMLDVNEYGAAGHLAALWTMAPFYFIEGPELKEFEERTGIQVTSVPLLSLQIPKSHLAKDSHLNKLGQRDRANAMVGVVKVTDGDTQLTFEDNGLPKVA